LYPVISILQFFAISRTPLQFSAPLPPHPRWAGAIRLRNAAANPPANGLTFPSPRVTYSANQDSELNQPRTALSKSVD